MDTALNAHNMKLAEAMCRGIDSGHLAHAYLVVGNPRQQGRTFVEYVLARLFCRSGSENPPCGNCTACRHVQEHAHPDIHWLEPEMKTRVFDLKAIRYLNHVIAETTFEGGWKAAVILFAERLSAQQAAPANAFLKTLEEPPPRTLLLLVSESPQTILPTIRSRCQRLILSEDYNLLDESWIEELVEILRPAGVVDPLSNARAARRLEAILAREKARIAEQAAQEQPLQHEDAEENEQAKKIRDARIESRVREVRERILRCMVLWQRDIMVLTQCPETAVLHFKPWVDDLRSIAAQAGYAGALKRLAAMEDIVRRMSKNITYLSGIFETGWARMTR